MQNSKGYTPPEDVPLRESNMPLSGQQSSKLSTADQLVCITNFHIAFLSILVPVDHPAGDTKSASSPLLDVSAFGHSYYIIM